MADLKAFAEQLVNLTVKEVNELVAVSAVVEIVEKIEFVEFVANREL